MIGGMVEARGSAVKIEHIVKRFGEGDRAVYALADVSLDIHDNEFFTLLGPSGCGKTTLLRCIAGFEQPTDGRTLLFGDEIDELPPNKRPVNTVFQHYALFPHMTVAENVGFGLRMLKRSKSDIELVVQRILKLVHMDNLADRHSSQLSGGQQQRVALARALATQPKVLLLDEPLSALDLKLRQQMRVELKQLQEETGITFIFVTHDQEEALTMSDRIAVMSDGKVQQVGTPTDVYERPINHFVADFIGETNFFDVTVESVNDGKAICVAPGRARVVVEAIKGCKVGDSVTLSVRPERIRFADNGVDGGSLSGVIERQIYLGTDTHYQVRLSDGTSVLMRVQNAHGDASSVAVGDTVTLGFDPGAVVMLMD
jgi:spermidine/putrescine transport system ATP-binding protein